MRKKLRRGGGEFIGFAIGMLGLCTMILMLLGVFQLCMASSQLENAANLISRDIVSEESLNDARTKAKTDAENLLGEMCIRDRYKPTELVLSTALLSARPDWKIGIPVRCYARSAAVSYTHLDVYKRQVQYRLLSL